MIRKIRVESFKSLVQLELELGRVNVLVGANGSGKSNILEAFGILGAAAAGRVDDEALLRRGVRPGVPALYKSAFEKTRGAPHLSFGAFTEEGGSYEVTLWNPLEDPSPAWRFKTETLRQSATGDKTEKVFSRSVREKENQEQGMAALKRLVEGRPGADKRNERLGKVRAGGRPKTLAGSSTHDHRIEHGSPIWPLHPGRVTTRDAFKGIVLTNCNH